MTIARLLSVLALAALAITGCASERGPVSAADLEANQASSLQYAYSLYDTMKGQEGANVESHLYKTEPPSSLADIFPVFATGDGMPKWAVVQRYAYGGALLVTNVTASKTKTIREYETQCARQKDGVCRLNALTGRTKGPVVQMIKVVLSTKDPTRAFVFWAVGPADNVRQLSYDLSKVLEMTAAF
jgi:hypothetical protein